jgi:ribose 5-phosphate isomerase B
MIAIGSDHGGFALKEKIMAFLDEKGIAYHDMGCHSESSCDYPTYGRMVAVAVAEGACDKGIVICTTGVGISMTANKVKGIRCALCNDLFTAKMTRLHNDANVLAMGGGVVGDSLAKEIVWTFLQTEFSQEEKHIRRIELIKQTEDMTTL